MIPLLTALIMFLGQELTIPESSSNLTVQIIIPTATICSSMLAGWIFIFKYFMKQNQKQFTFALSQNQEQFDKALTQSQSLFNKSLEQIEKQHKENLEESRRTNDKLFEVIQKDTEYKEILAGLLTEMKNTLKSLNLERNE